MFVYNYYCPLEVVRRLPTEDRVQLHQSPPDATGIQTGQQLDSPHILPTHRFSAYSVRAHSP